MKIMAEQHGVHRPLQQLVISEAHIVGTISRLQSGGFNVFAVWRLVCANCLEKGSNTRGAPSDVEFDKVSRMHCKR